MMTASRSVNFRAKPYAVVAQEVRNEQLEAKIKAAPDAVERYLDYAVWLQLRGAPRGTLIALQAALHGEPLEWLRSSMKRAAQRLIEVHNLLIEPEAGELEVEWTHGFVAHAELRLAPGMGDVGLAKILRQPSFRFLRSLRLVAPQLSDTAALVSTLNAHAPSTLTQLAFQSDEGSNKLFRALLSTCPLAGLERLELLTNVVSEPLGLGS